VSRRFTSGIFFPVEIWGETWVWEDRVWRAAQATRKSNRNKRGKRRRGKI